MKEHAMKKLLLGAAVAVFWLQTAFAQQSPAFLVTDPKADDQFYTENQQNPDSSLLAINWQSLLLHPGTASFLLGPKHQDSYVQIDQRFYTPDSELNDQLGTLGKDRSGRTARPSYYLDSLRTYAVTKGDTNSNYIGSFSVHDCTSSYITYQFVFTLFVRQGISMDQQALLKNTFETAALGDDGQPASPAPDGAFIETALSITVSIPEFNDRQSEQIHAATPPGQNTFLLHQQLLPVPSPAGEPVLTAENLARQLNLISGVVCDRHPVTYSHPKRIANWPEFKFTTKLVSIHLKIWFVRITVKISVPVVQVRTGFIEATAILYGHPDVTASISQSLSDCLNEALDETATMVVLTQSYPLVPAEFASAFMTCLEDDAVGLLGCFIPGIQYKRGNNDWHYL
jgi:hypothetical protein